MSVSPIFPLQGQEVITIPELTKTDAKVQKTAYLFFGSISFFIANGLVNLGGILALLSLPVYTLTLIFAIRFFDVKDYENSQDLESYRKEAKEQTLEEVIRSHGLFNTLHHNILTPPDFADKLRQHAITLNPTDIAKLYIELSEVLRRLDLSMENFRPSFQESMTEALSEKKPTEIFKTEEMDLLIQTGLISQELVTSYQTFQSHSEHFHQQQAAIRNCYKESFISWIDTFSSHVNAAIANQPSAYLKMLKRDLDYLKAHPDLENIDSKLPIFEEPTTESSNHPKVQAFHNEFGPAVSHLASELKNALNADKDNYLRALSAIDDQY